MGNNKVTSGRKAKKFSQVDSKLKVIIVIGIVAIIGVAGGIGILTYQYIVSQAQAPATTVSTTTIELECYVSGEDVSWVKVNVWFPKDSSIFDDPEDIRTKSMYELEVTADEAEDVSIDVSEIPYFIVEIDPADASVYSNTEFVEIGGYNRVLDYDVKDRVTDYNFNIVNSTMGAIDLTTGFTNKSTSDNYTLIMDCDHYMTTAAQMHYGDNWETTTTEFNALDALDQLWFYDEKNFACLDIIYDTSVDTDKDFDDPLERLTNAPAIKFTFNTTLSTVDGNTAQVNFTVGNEVPAEIVYSGTIIYLIFYDDISFEYGSVSYLFEMQTSTHIELNDVDSGWLTVPGDDDHIGAFVKASDIGT
jgi:hypothetical protein